MVEKRGYALLGNPYHLATGLMVIILIVNSQRYFIMTSLKAALIISSFLDQSEILLCILSQAA